MFRIVAKGLCHRHRGVADTESGTWWFIHLSEDHDGVVTNTGGSHLAVQFFGFSASLTDSAEQADSIVTADDVVDQLSDQNGFANACATE